MSAAKATTSVDDLVQQLADVRAALTEERQRLMDRVTVIDQALGSPSPAKPAKGTKAVRTPGIGDAVVQFVKLRPWSTIKEIQAGFPDANPSSVESTVRNLAAAGKLIKDDGATKRFALAGTKPQA